MPKMIAPIDANPVVKPIMVCIELPLGSGFKGTKIWLPGNTLGWVLKNKNLRVPLTVPLGYTTYAPDLSARGP